MQGQHGAPSCAFRHAGRHFSFFCTRTNIGRRAQAEDSCHDVVSGKGRGRAIPECSQSQSPALQAEGRGEFSCVVSVLIGLHAAAFLTSADGEGMFLSAFRTLPGRHLRPAQLFPQAQLLTGRCICLIPPSRSLHTPSSRPRFPCGSGCRSSSRRQPASSRQQHGEPPTLPGSHAPQR